MPSTGDNMEMEFRILGPLEVRVNGAVVAVGGPRQRALLAMLLLSANQVVSRDRLIDELLDPAADKADHMLRVQVSRLRGALANGGDGAERLTARPPGYILRVEPGELDLQMFEGLVAQGHAALEAEQYREAAGALRRAESLWRGRPLADLEFERFARIDVDRLEEMRLVALEDRTDAELAMGQHAMLVPELEARVAEHPLRERSRGQLMLAQYRCGQQADALESYRTGRAFMSDELALEPSPALRKLEQAILRQDTELDLPEKQDGAIATAVVERPAPPTDADENPPEHRAPGSGLRNRVIAGGIAVGVVVAAVAGILLATEGSRQLTAVANSIATVDPASGTVMAVLPAGGPPGGISSGLGAVWETDTANDLLLEINPRTRAVERIPVGRDPTAVAVGGGEVWVANQLDRSVSEINPRALQRVASFPVGNGAAAIAFGDGSVWVANVVDDTVTRIDVGSGKETTIPLAGQPGGLAVGPQGVWVASQSTRQLLLIDPSSNQVTQAIAVGNQPAGVVVGSGAVWVANTADGTVSRLNPGTGQVTEIDVGRGPIGMAAGAGGIWVANSLGGTIARINPSTGSATSVQVGDAPSALTVAGGRVWTTVLPGVASHIGGTLRVAEGGIYDSFGNSLDPAQWAGFPQWQMLSLTNDGLVTYRRIGGLAGASLVPDLATSLPSPTDGGRTYTFQMRTGIHYSNGVLVRPQDIKHEFQRIYRLRNSYAEFMYTGIVGAAACMHAPTHCTFTRGIVANNRTNTVTFHLTAPDPDFLYKLAFSWADAIPATTPYRSLGRSPPPATGPYMTQSISPSRGPGIPGHGTVAFHTWTLVRNPRFREWSAAAQPSGYPNRIVLTSDESLQRAATAVAQNSLDVLATVPADRLADFATHYTQRFHSEPVGATFSLALNTRQPPFDRLAVRQALNYAVDRNRIVGFAGGALAAQPTCQILPPTIPGYEPYCPYTRRPSPSGTWQSPDLARAQRLVAGSGTSGMKVTVLVEPSDPTNPTTTIGAYTVALLDRLGYRASLRVSSQLFSILGNSRSRTQSGWFPWYQDFPTPSDFITPLLTCRAFQPGDPSNVNVAEFCNPRVDAGVSRASALEATSPGAASQEWSQVDRQITDQAPWLPLYNPRIDIATSSRVGNYQYHPFFALLLDQLWVR
jgi:ABC-type transport system substrate-binding protein/DNA-binding SARP family transcriptional activator